jgi:hypothetical protein
MRPGPVREGREIIEFKGIQVPVYRDRFGGITVSVMSSLEQKKFFFTDGHGGIHIRGGKVVSLNLTDDWVPITSRLPHDVVARPRFPEGRIETIEDMVDLHHSDEELTTYEEVIKDSRNLRR